MIIDFSEQLISVFRTILQFVICCKCRQFFIVLKYKEHKVYHFNHFQLYSLVAVSICNVLQPSPKEGKGTPLQCSCLENPMDRGAWWAAVHGVAKSRTRLSGFTFTFHFHTLEKEMATHSSVLAWRIPGMVEPGGLLSMESRRVGHD